MSNITKILTLGGVCAALRLVDRRSLDTPTTNLFIDSLDKTLEHLKAYTGHGTNAMLIRSRSSPRLAEKSENLCLRVYCDGDTFDETR
jgi:hypothetical protein